MSTDDYDKLRSKHYINPLSGHPGIYSNREFYKWCKYIEDTYGIIFNMNGYLKRNIFTIKVIITGIEINQYHEDKITPEVIDEFDKLAETANNVNYRFYIAKWE